LPEEIIKNRKEIELKKNAITAAISLCVGVVGLFYFLFNKIELGMISSRYNLIEQSNKRLEKQLSLLDRQIYQDDLKKRKYLNYGVSYLSVLNLIPVSYEVNSFKFVKLGNWNLELTLSSDSGGIFDPISKVGILKNADIKDTFVNNQPGKHLKITL
jgi:hypothetical protein